MGSTNHLASLAPVYRKALKTWRPVIWLFTNEHCPACEWAESVFREVAQRYRHHANIYVLSTSESPRHPNVTGTPTVLFFKDGRLLKKLKGIGSQETLEEDFASHVGRLRPQFVAHRPNHDVAWLRQTLRGLCTVPRAFERLNCRSGC
jgi:thioredoxin 1